MSTRVKEIAQALSGGRHVGPLQVVLLNSEQPTEAAFTVDLLSAADRPADWQPPKTVRFLAAGENVARDGRKYTVADPAKVVQLSTAYKGATDLVIDLDHQTERSKANGQPAPAQGWIKKLSATGPDGTPGLWADVDWLPHGADLIRSGKYRYLSAVIGADPDNNVTILLRASLLNTPAMDTASALFTATPEPIVTLLQKLLAALGFAAGTSEDAVIQRATALHAFAVALANQMNVDVAALSAMTAEAAINALRKPLADKLATLSASAKVAVDASPEVILAGIQALSVDPAKYVAKSVYDDVSTRLATLTADNKSKLIETATKEGKLTPAMKAWAESMTVEQLSAFLATAPKLVEPAREPGGDIPETVATLSAEDKAEAAKHGVTEEAWLNAKKAERADADRRKALFG